MVNKVAYLIEVPLIIANTIVPIYISQTSLLQFIINCYVL